MYYIQFNESPTIYTKHSELKNMKHCNDHVYMVARATHAHTHTPTVSYRKPALEVSFSYFDWCLATGEMWPKEYLSVLQN